jgi:hypothetical protein
MEKLRTQAEIVRACDLLTLALMSDGAKHILSAAGREAAMGFGLALCWVLRHPHNTVFSDFLTEIEGCLDAHGLVYDPVRRELRAREMVH